MSDREQARQIIKEARQYGRYGPMVHDLANALEAALGREERLRDFTEWAAGLGQFESATLAPIVERAHAVLSSVDEETHV